MKLVTGKSINWTTVRGSRLFLKYFGRGGFIRKSMIMTNKKKNTQIVKIKEEILGK